MKPLQTLTRFDAFLATRGLELDAVVIGGAALVLLGVVDRVTRDCDVLQPDLPLPIAEAAIAFAVETRKGGDELADDWLNNGPSALIKALEPGWEGRVVRLFTGRALRLSVPGRSDLLCSKLWALCDRLTDFDDCVALAPSAAELAAVLPWLEVQDLNPDWPQHVREQLDRLRRTLGHGL